MPWRIPYNNLMRVKESYFISRGMVGTKRNLEDEITPDARLSALTQQRIGWFWRDIEYWAEMRIPEATRKNLTTVAAVAKYLDSELGKGAIAMGINTNIEWCDSTLNPEIGCDGCELWNVKTCIHCGRPIEKIEVKEAYRHKNAEDNTAGHVAEPIKTCYAGQLVSRYAGHSKGYPPAFEQPQLFLERLLDAERWRDLTGTVREDKPWLNGLPRCIFLNDLGDTFTESLPLDWMAQPADVLGGRTPLDVLAGAKAIIMLLTKRPSRMKEFFASRPVPDNFILMTSVTGPETLQRVQILLQIKARWHGVSAEPLLRPTLLDQYLERLSWVIGGLESGRNRRECADGVETFRKLRDRCARLKVAFFAKQLDKVTPLPDDLLKARYMPAFTIQRQQELALA